MYGLLYHFKGRHSILLPSAIIITVCAGNGNHDKTRHPAGFDASYLLHAVGLKSISMGKISNLPMSMHRLSTSLLRSLKAA